MIDRFARRVSRHERPLLTGLFLTLIASAAFAANGDASGRASLDVFTMLSGLIGGLAIFLYGMTKMADALKAVAGDRLRLILAKMTTNRVTGAVTGAVVTAIIQSSSVTTVLVVGFITAQLMSFSQAIGVIFGANVGTTITAQIIAFKITKYALLLIAGGFGMQFVSRAEAMKHYGSMMMGMGLLFFGMGVMSDEMRPLRDYQPFLDLMERMDNPALAILIAAVFTGLVQASAATTGIVIVMASQGLMTLPTGIAFVFGSNIGTCVTALFASIGKPLEAVRAAAAHILFNVIGVLLWLPFINPLADLIIVLSPKAAELEGVARLAVETPRQIANAHTVFNVANTILFLPFAGLIARLVERIVPDGRADDTGAQRDATFSTWHLNPSLLDTPALAIEQGRREILHMGEIVREMLVEIMPAFLSNDLQTAETLLHRDSQVDFLQKQTSDYLTKIGQSDLSSDLSERNIRLHNVATEMKHIGDVIERNLVPLLSKKAEDDVAFSEEGRDELVAYHGRVLKCFDDALAAFRDDDLDLARAVAAEKPEIVQLEMEYRRTHFARLTRELSESVASSQIHLDLIDYLRRINSYSESIASAVIVP